MKRTTLFLFLIFLFSTSSVFAQKLKDKRAKITYVSLPSKQLPSDYTTYSVNVYGRAMIEGGTNANALSKRIKMDGFKRVHHHEGGGHLRIVVNTSSVAQGRAERQSKKNVKKDKDTGKETVTWSYWYEVPFSAGPTYSIYDPEGNILDSGGGSQNTTKKSRSYSSTSLLSKNYQNQMNSMRKSFAKEVTNGIIGQVTSSLGKKFDYKKTYEHPQIYLITKYKTEAQYAKYFEQIDKEWKELDAATPTETLRAKFADALAFYEEEAKIDPKGDKKLSRVFEAANYNVAVLSFYLDDFEKTVHYANRVIANAGKHKRASNYIEKVQATKNLMDMHNIHTMHYARDLSQALAPAAMEDLALEQAEIESANDVLEGTITVNGEKIHGTFMSEKKARELDFSENGNTKFLSQKDGENVEHDLTSEKITAFSIGDRTFVKMDFAPCAKGKSELGYHILEELYTSDKINLYKYYPSGGALNEAKTEFAFKKVTDETPVSLYDTQFLILKKGLAKYFAACEDLKALCEEGGIELEEESLLKGARIYAEVCE